jgi:hypothetical protein
MVKILRCITALQKEGNLKPSNLLLAFLDARMSPLQRHPHKMCFLGSTRDPICHSSGALTAVEVVQKANRIAEAKLSASWEWGLRPHDCNNPIAEVYFVGLRLSFAFFELLSKLTVARLAWAELVCFADREESSRAPNRLGCRQGAFGR